MKETKATILYLESVETVLNQAGLEEIAEIREELIQTGFIRRRQRRENPEAQKPEQYLASDGKTIIYVGRNNLQNEELTFKMARKEELWFHTRTFLEAMLSSQETLTHLMKSRQTQQS